MPEKELFKDIIDESIKTNNMSVFYIIVSSFISADNNMTEEEIKENCRLIDLLIDVLDDYSSNEDLQKWKQKLIEYNKMYKNSHFENVVN